MRIFLNIFKMYINAPNVYARGVDYFSFFLERL